jgi:hypothetical protein
MMPTYKSIIPVCSALHNEVYYTTESYFDSCTDAFKMRTPLKEALCQVFRFSVISMVYGSVVAYLNMLSCEMNDLFYCQHAL